MKLYAFTLAACLLASAAHAQLTEAEARRAGELAGIVTDFASPEVKDHGLDIIAADAPAEVRLEALRVFLERLTTPLDMCAVDASLMRATSPTGALTPPPDSGRRTGAGSDYNRGPGGF